MDEVKYNKDYVKAVNKYEKARKNNYKYVPFIYTEHLINALSKYRLSKQDSELLNIVKENIFPVTEIFKEQEEYQRNLNKFRVMHSKYEYRKGAERTLEHINKQVAQCDFNEDVIDASDTLQASLDHITIIKQKLDLMKYGIPVVSLLFEDSIDEKKATLQEKKSYKDVYMDIMHDLEELGGMLFDY